MLPIIQSLWIGNELSLLERLVVSSFLANGHEFHLYSYSPIIGVPTGAIIKDANDIIKKSQIFTCNGSYALFADWFRWKLINRMGGYWVDMDVICLKPFDFTDDIVYGMQDKWSPAIGVLKFPVGHELTSFMLHRCEEFYGFREPIQIKIKNMLRRMVWGNRKDDLAWGHAGGPTGFRIALEKYGLLGIGKSVSIFYPVHYDNWQDIFTSVQHDNIADLTCSFSVHFWNEMVRCSKLDKNGCFAENSLIELLKNKYMECIDAKSSDRYVTI